MWHVLLSCRFEIISDVIHLNFVFIRKCYYANTNCAMKFKIYNIRCMINIINTNLCYARICVFDFEMHL
jgi:hypothetical protein